MQALQGITAPDALGKLCTAVTCTCVGGIGHHGVWAAGGTVTGFLWSLRLTRSSVSLLACTTSYISETASQSMFKCSDLPADIHSREDVLKMGIGKYNEECRSIVMR